MALKDTAAELTEFTNRAAASDAERRAARWLAERVRGEGRRAQIETCWIRPDWALALALYSALGIAGSLLSRPVAGVGAAVLLVTLASYLAELSGQLELLRRLTPRRATQNVVSPALAARAVRLVICAPYDAPRSGFVYRTGVRALEARARRALRGHLPGGQGLIALCLLLLTAAAGARVAGAGGTVLNAAQIAPTAMLLVAFALSIDTALSDAAPGASANAGGVAVALALSEALREAPPKHLSVELVLAGAGHGAALGMRDYVARRRRESRAEDVALLEIGPCGAGNTHFVTRDGPGLVRRLHPRLIELAREVAADHPALHAQPCTWSRGASGAWAARVAGWPAIAVRSLDGRGIAPRAGTAADLAEALDERSLRDALQFSLAIVSALDAELA